MALQSIAHTKPIRDDRADGTPGIEPVALTGETTRRGQRAHHVNDTVPIACGRLAQPLPQVGRGCEDERPSSPPDPQRVTAQVAGYKPGLASCVTREE